MGQLMKQMGLQQEEIEARRVEITCPGKKIIIEPASVTSVNVMGQQTWQVMGEAREELLETTPEISAEDVKTVAEQTGASEEEARAAIEETNGDLAAAIIKLQE